MSRYDLKSFLKMREYDLHKIMVDFLHNCGYGVLDTPDYIYAVKDTDCQIGLVAHLDTVFREPPTDDEIFYDSERMTFLGLNGLGGDDRVGVFLIYNLILNKFRFNINKLPNTIILTHGEENVCIGAQAFCETIPELVYPVKYFVELDRAGVNDSVFYDLDCLPFEDYINNLIGTETARGSYTDIVFLTSKYRIPAVNLSVGYENEHTESEIIDVSVMWDTYHKVDRLLGDFRAARELTFEYKEKDRRPIIKPETIKFSEVDNPLADTKECFYCGRELNIENRDKIQMYNGYFPCCKLCKTKY